MDAALQLAAGSIPSREAGAAFFDMLFKVVANVAANPSEPKFRTIKLSNKGFHNKIGQFPGGLDCMKALGFEEAADGKIVMALTWGMPDVTKLRDGYAAMAATAARIGASVPPVDFSACDPGATVAPPAAPPAAPVQATPESGEVRTFKVRDSTKYSIGTIDTFRSKDGSELRGRVLSLEPLANTADAPYAARITVMADSPIDTPPLPSAAAEEWGAEGHVLTLNAEARLAPSGWAAKKQSRLEDLRAGVFGVVARAAAEPRAMSYGVGTTVGMIYRDDNELFSSAMQHMSESGEPSCSRQPVASSQGTDMVYV